MSIHGTIYTERTAGQDARVASVAPANSLQFVHTTVAFFRRSKLIAAFILAKLKQKYLNLAGNIGLCMQMTSDSNSILLWRVYFSMGNFCESWVRGRSIGLALGCESCILPVKTFTSAESCLRAELPTEDL